MKINLDKLKLKKPYSFRQFKKDIKKELSKKFVKVLGKFYNLDKEGNRYMFIAVGANKTFGIAVELYNNEMSNRFDKDANEFSLLCCDLIGVVEDQPIMGNAEMLDFENGTKYSSLNETCELLLKQYYLYNIKEEEKHDNNKN